MCICEDENAHDFGVLGVQIEGAPGGGEVPRLGVEKRTPALSKSTLAQPLSHLSSPPFVFLFGDFFYSISSVSSLNAFSLRYSYSSTVYHMFLKRLNKVQHTHTHTLTHTHRAREI